MVDKTNNTRNNRASSSGLTPDTTRVRRVRRVLAVALAAAMVFVAVTNVDVYRTGRAQVVDEGAVARADCILVLGARVYPDGRPSTVLQDRLETALRLYRAGRASRILVSGDHGADSYDEPTAMRRWLEARGVPREAIFQDHAGFDTYSSMYRARAVFGAQRVLVVTQAFHLPRALYLAVSLGMQAEGVPADARSYQRAGYYQVREVASRTRAFLDVRRGRRPRAEGEAIPLGGDGRITDG